LPPIPSLNLKAALGQKPQKHTSSSLIILKKSPAIIVTRNTLGAREARDRSLKNRRW
jgi:hypothetical protein